MNTKISRNGLLKNPYDNLVCGTNTFGDNVLGWVRKLMSCADARTIQSLDPAYPDYPLTTSLMRHEQRLAKKKLCSSIVY
jgi:hypothetical protein